MSHEITVDQDRGFVLLRPRGELKAGPVIEMIDEMLAHPDFKSGMAGVWDLGHCDTTPLVEAELRQITEANIERRDARGRARIALIAEDDIAFGAMRMYEVLGIVPHLEFATFREMEPALEWALAGRGSP